MVTNLYQPEVLLNNENSNVVLIASALNELNP
jgi:hypothetical protein